MGVEWLVARRSALRLATAAVAAFSSAPAAACQLALVMALDVSSSVDAHEYRLQRDGLASALLDPEVSAAILDIGGILASAYEWSGVRQQVMMVDWSHLDSDKTIVDFAGRLHEQARSHADLPTALGYALGFGATQLRRAPEVCARRVIDVSGDGVSNDGFPPALAYRHFPFADVTVNGLVIAGADPDPVAYYQDEVIRGPGAFVEVASDFASYHEAMRRKLLREIRGAIWASAGGHGDPALDREAHLLD